MNEERNKKLIRTQHEDIWSKGKLKLVDQVYAPGFSCHPIGSPTWRGPEDIRERIRVIRTAFPDWTETVEDMIAENDRVVTRFVSTGTHRGPFQGIKPTGRRIRVDEVAIYRIEEGKIAEQWLFQDPAGLLRQLTEE